MPTCEQCETPGHAREKCANQNVPMINKTCQCRCDRPDFDPAPYWSALSASKSADPADVNGADPRSDG